MGEEKRNPGDDAFAGAEGLLPEIARGPRAITKHRLVGDAVVHVIHGAGFRDHRLPGRKCDLDDLHVVAEYLVLDIIRHARMLLHAPRAVKKSPLSDARRAFSHFHATGLFKSPTAFPFHASGQHDKVPAFQRKEGLHPCPRAILSC